jgi:predicted ATPase/class 3 adenylate cyclase
MLPEGGALPKGSAPAALPSGEVTFLFTDIEGSTQRWEAHADAMKAAVARHEQLMKGAIALRGGYVFKSLGDALCAAFHCAPDAIAAAMDAQRVLAEEDFSSVDGLRVRMGLHSGRAEERDADYFGPTVNRVARLMSIGHGGQVLVSAAVVDALHAALPAEATLIDLGLRRLKDLTQPEHVWQLTTAGLPREFPPLNSLDEQANNLPIQLTSLFGREQDVEDVKTLLGRHRLLTISGSGGVGKTRLALQAGADLLDRYPDGVWFADLAPVSDQALVASVVASVIGMTQRADQRVDKAIPNWLKRKRLLLILDNCEHVIGAAASLADGILAAAPGVRVLATSRQALGISGEAVHRMPSLAVPDDVRDLRALEALRYGSIALFVDRARAVDARFALTDHTAPIVAEICRRLDGIPFAIELAAARVKVLSIPNLAQRLSDRFKILTGGSRTAMPRQKTLGALIEWSYGLLTPKEQTLFNRIGIFAGGFSLDSAGAVCGADGVDDSDELDLISSLTDKSLVVADTSAEQERYHLLESTRAYALEKLRAAGEYERLARRHGEYFRDQAKEAETRFGVGSSAAWLARVELDQDNFRAALEWALGDGHDVELGGEVVGALERFWSNAGLTAEGRYWIGRAQNGLAESENTNVSARLWRALALLSDGKHRRDPAKRALALYESVHDAHGMASSRILLADSLNQMGHVAESEEAYVRALAAMRECGDEPGVARCLTQLAYCLCTRGEVVAGHEMFAQALAAYKVLGDEDATAQVLGNLAESEFNDGHVVEALRAVEEALAIHARSKNSRRLAMNYNNSAVYRIAIGELDVAHGVAREGLRWARQAQIVLQTAVALQHLALIAVLHGQAHRAARLAGYVSVQYQELGYEREPTEKWSYEKLMAALLKQLSKAEIEKLEAEGAGWTEDRAVEEALKV